MRLVDPDYLLLLFDNNDFLEEKKLLYKNIGKRKELLKLIFDSKNYEECFNICWSN